MQEARATRGDSAGRERYEIRVKGHLDDRWAGVFPGVEIRRDADGTTVLVGDALDQSALHGVLKRVRDLGLPLLSVVRSPADPPAGDESVTG